MPRVWVPMMLVPDVYFLCGSSSGEHLTCAGRMEIFHPALQYYNGYGSSLVAQEIKDLALSPLWLRLLLCLRLDPMPRNSTCQGRGQKKILQWILKIGDSISPPSSTLSHSLSVRILASLRPSILVHFCWILFLLLSGQTAW